MTITISIIAIILSLASFGFSIYQYKIGSQIKINEKTNSLLKDIYKLRRNLEDKKNLYASTDDIPDFEETFESSVNFIENEIKVFLQKGELPLNEFYRIERAFMGVQLEFDLMCKQIDEAIRFNKECVAAGMEPMNFKNYD